MLIKHILIEGIRNLNFTVKLEFNRDFNFFVGPNGSGKTSLLESIYCLALGRSFKASKLDHVINNDASVMKISSVFSDKTMEQHVKITMLKQLKHEKIVKLGGSLAKSTEIALLAPVQLINDETSHLIFKNSELRRKFLDWLVFYSNQNYHQEWQEFNRLLFSRNQLLKKIQENNDAIALKLLAKIDPVFVKIAEKVTAARTLIWDQFVQVWHQLRTDLNLTQSKVINVEFFKGWSNELSKQLNNYYKLDVKFGYTQVGPHKADLKFMINHKFMAKDLLSKGQAKILALSMILARSKFIQTINYNPNFVSILLIDDLLAELDDNNVNKILHELFKLKESLQIFLTGTDANKLLHLCPYGNESKWFKVCAGQISQWDNVSSGI